MAPPDSSAIAEAEQADPFKACGRFVLWFFIAGACAPVAWIALSYATVSYSPVTHVSDAVAAMVWYVECATFPTVFFFIDAEHPAEIIITLLFAMPINGAYYAVVGLVVWCVREGVRRLWKRR
jgi:hypothetical protein